MNKLSNSFWKNNKKYMKPGKFYMKKKCKKQREKKLLKQQLNKQEFKEI